MSYALRTTPTHPFARTARAVVLCAMCYVLLAPILVLPAFAQDAQNADEKCKDAYGLKDVACEAGLVGKDDKTPQTLAQVIGRIINAALSLLGIAFFLLMLYAGFKWMTAQGDPEIVKKSRDTIVAAVIGLAIVIAAYAIVDFIFKNVIP